MSHATLMAIINWVCFLAAVAACIWFLFRWLRGSREPVMLIFRWGLTAVCLFALYRAGVRGGKSLEAEDMSALFLVVAAVAAGIFLGLVWIPVIGEFVSRTIGGIYTGGDAEVDPAPVYSIYHGKRNHGKYYEALAEVRKQLEKFPTDYEGYMLMAELQAENLNDLPGAELTITKLCEQPGHAHANVAHALNRLADWHLAIADRDAAKRALEKIEELLPETEMSLVAAQRIAHLADPENLLASHNQRKINVQKGVENLGLVRDDSTGRLKPPQEDLDKVAAEYVKQLELHPQDSEARERLAVIYAKHFHRLDLAVDQLEQLIQQPNRFPKQVVHWLNLMADLQVQEGADFEHIEGTLRRITEGFPGQAFADTAQRRIDVLKLELKNREPRQSFKVGAYEQNIGLKRGV